LKVHEQQNAILRLQECVGSVHDGVLSIAAADPGESTLISETVTGLCAVALAVSPVGPPHRREVVAGRFLRFRNVLVDEYPSVMASTNNAPGMTGGLPTGMSNQRQPTPTAKLMISPSKNFMMSSPD
jgi:hypothetical protein